MHTHTACLALATLASNACAGGPVVFDGFIEGPVELVSSGNPVGGNYDAPSVPAGRRTVTFFNSHQDGVLTIDVSLGELRLDTNGLGQCSFSYGWMTIDGSGQQNSWTHRLDADWSAYEAVRIPVLRNTTRLWYSANVGTQRLSFEPSPYLGSSSTPIQNFVDGGFTGNIDIPFSAFMPSSGSNPVDWADVDRFLITVASGFVDSDLTIGPIQLLPARAPEDLNADGAVSSADLSILLAAWGPCPPESPCPADLDGDDDIDAADLAILLAAWGS